MNLVFSLPPMPVQIRGLTKCASRLPVLRYAYRTPGYYALDLRATRTGWAVTLAYLINK